MSCSEEEVSPIASKLSKLSSVGPDDLRDLFQS